MIMQLASSNSMKLAQGRFLSNKEYRALRYTEMLYKNTAKQIIINSSASIITKYLPTYLGTYVVMEKNIIICTEITLIVRNNMLIHTRTGDYFRLNFNEHHVGR
jgi:hypothetical protein